MDVQRAQPALVDLAQQPLQRRVLGRRRHLGERRVLLLEAVVAGEVALQRRHQGHVHRAGDAFARLVQVCADPGVVLEAIANEKSVFHQHVLRFVLLRGRRLIPRGPPSDAAERRFVDAGVAILDDAVEDVLARPNVLVCDHESGELHCATPYATVVPALSGSLRQRRRASFRACGQRSGRASGLGTGPRPARIRGAGSRGDAERTQSVRASPRGQSAGWSGQLPGPEGGARIARDALP